MHILSSTYSRIRLALFAMILLCSVCSSQAGAQTRVDQYKVETGSDFVWDYWQGEYLGWGYDDLMYTKLPFDYEYDGVKYPAGSQIAISPNGWFSFNPNADMYDYGNLGNENYPNTVYVLGMDLNLWGSAYAWNDNGKLNITWEYAEDAYGYGYWNYFQVTLDSKDNSISMSYYGNCWWMHPYGEAVAVGLNGNNGKEGFSYNVYSMDPWSPCENIKFRAPKPDKPGLMVSTNTLAFGNVGLGLTQTLCLTVTNNGTAGEPGGSKNPLTFNPAIVTGSPAEFTVKSSPAGPLDIGESAQYCVEFKPNGPNTRTSTLTIVSNAGNAPVSMTGKGVAAEMAVDVNQLFRKSRTKVAGMREESFWIKSTGLAPLQITSATISGDYPEQYSVVSYPTAPIVTGDSGKVTVRFSPMYEGLKTGVLTINGTGYAKKTHVVNLFGTGILPRLVVTPRMIGPDSVAMGDTAYYSVRLANTGSDTLRILKDFFVTADRDFTYMPLAATDAVIPPEQFRDVMIRFVPASRGTRLARLRILSDIPPTFEAKPRDTSTFTVDIMGIGVPYGLMSVEGNAHFDSVMIGSEICKPVEIWNNGQLPLTVTSAMVTGADDKDFVLSGVTFPVTIQPMSKVDVQVCATPAERGERNASLTVVAASDDRTTTRDLPLEVFGLLACSSPDATTLFEGQIVKLGRTKTEQVTVTNCGDIPVMYVGSIIGQGYTITSNPLSDEVLPGSSYTFDVEYSANTMSLQNATLRISPTSTVIPDMMIALAGTGGNSVLAATNNSVSTTGAPVDFDVTVTNSGNFDWSVGAPVVSGTEFTLKASPTNITSANGTGIFTFTFTPQTGSNHQAGVTFPNSDNTTFTFVLNGAVGSSDVAPVAMNGYELRQSYPNPSAGASTIAFTMAEAGMAKIVINDITGNVVAVIADGFFVKGENVVKFDGSALTSGNYFYQLTANGTRLERALTIRK
jgi:hypothetical protein